jgi:ankyrin repeat protein
MVASDKGHAAVVRELLTFGADVNTRNDGGCTALHWASSYVRAEAMRELLVLRPDINAQGGAGVTPLMDACVQGHLMAATILIGHGANLALLNNAGQSALSVAEWRVRQDAVAPAAPPAAPPAAGAAPPPAVVTEAQRAEHKALVAVLKAHGAT